MMHGFNAHTSILSCCVNVMLDSELLSGACFRVQVLVNCTSDLELTRFIQG